MSVQVIKREHPLLRGIEPQIVAQEVLSFCDYKDILAFSGASRSARNLAQDSAAYKIQTLFPTDYLAIMRDAQEPLNALAHRCSEIQKDLNYAKPEELNNPNLIGPKLPPFEAAFRKTKEKALTEFYRDMGDLPKAAYKQERQERYLAFIAEQNANYAAESAALDPHLVGFVTEAHHPFRELRAQLAMQLVAENEYWQQRYLHSLHLMHRSLVIDAMIDIHSGSFDATQHPTTKDIKTMQSILSWQRKSQELRAALAEDDFLILLNEEIDDIIETLDPFALVDGLADEEDVFRQGG
jgi:hypothetical protein